MGSGDELEAVRHVFSPTVTSYSHAPRIFTEPPASVSSRSPRKPELWLS